MKFAMAIVVVAIHTRPELSFSSPIAISLCEAVYSLAVPFFFMASGFLLFRKISFPLNEEGEQRIKAYLKKICKLYLIWTVIYLPLTVYGFYLDGLPFLKSVAIFIRNILLIGENYMSWPLWYLLALIVAVGIIYVLLKLKLSMNWIVAISTFMAIIGIGLDYCNENAILHPFIDLYFSAFLKTRNGFFVGFFYVALGMQLSHKEKLNMPLLFTIGLLGIIGMIMEAPLSSALIVWAIFVISISLTPQLTNMEVTVKCRLMSSIVYFIHMLWMAFFVIILGLDKGIILFGLVLLTSILSGCWLLRYRDRYFFRLCFN